jgi:hypothetical protein
MNAMKTSLPIGPKHHGNLSKKAQRERRTLGFMDETGFMLHPTVRQTWAPRGQTPIQHSWDRHDRLSVIGAITVSPIQNRLGFYFAMQAAHVTGEDLVAFVQRLHGHLKRPLHVIWDRFSGHKKAQRLLHDIYGRRIQGQYLPAYAPDLHVVDHAWSHTQYGERAILRVGFLFVRNITSKLWGPSQTPSPQSRTLILEFLFVAACTCCLGLIH